MSAYGALYRHDSDPDLLPKFIAAMERDLHGLAPALKPLAAWVVNVRTPLDLFRPEYEALPLADIPIELREGVEIAAHIAVSRSKSLGSVPSVEEAMVLILSGLVRQFATNLCAVEKAKSSFGLSSEDILRRVQVLEEKMVEAPEAKGFASRLLSVVPGQESRPRPKLRRRRVPQEDLLNKTIAR